MIPPGPTILVVNPNTTVAMTDEVVGAARRVAGPGTRVVGSTPERGVAAVETGVDEVWGAVSVLEQVLAGEQIGANGYVIACFGDVGLTAAREVAAGPVVGMTEAAVYTAALLAPRFSIVTLPPRTLEQSRRALRAIGLEHRCRVRAVDVGVTELASGAEAFLPAFVAESRRALEDDDAEAIVLGCAGLAELAEPLSEALGVPVIDGVAAAVRLVEGLLTQRLSTSRRSTFASPERLGPVRV